MDLVYNVGNRFCPTRFCPTETQLVNNYLVPKIASNDHLGIPEFDPFQLEPWNLPRKCIRVCHILSPSMLVFVILVVILCVHVEDLKITPDDLELYAFCPRFGRPKRTMTTGYWKATGYGSQIPPESAIGVTGTKKIFVFYKGKFPNGVNTNWVIHEYSVSITSPATQRTFVLCKIMKRADKKASVSTQSRRHEENVADDPFPEEVDPQMLEDMEQFFATYSE
ncbi:hypothetical protein K2173_023249 [Erythroxylum novogranatense]|uniref:NAC domain-containing protein n=1 Tax=Erythroxylum novogranatense TaxID=1862640 RepID=A0AAV8T9P2_9ROSI|nr:hypothetical protein K2173_023249 [Erythroxylum novogranatense]